MSDEPIRLPMVPEPTEEQRAALRAVMDDPDFWEWFENQPEPDDWNDE